jgi:hypothetical protein
MDDAFEVIFTGWCVSEALWCEVEVLDADEVFLPVICSGFGCRGCAVVHALDPFFPAAGGGLAGQFHLESAPAAQNFGGEVGRQ